MQNSNRHSFTNDFGLIALDIAHTIANDQGEYSVMAHNEQGEARVDGMLTIQSVDSLLLDTQHEKSWQRIQVFFFLKLILAIYFRKLKHLSKNRKTSLSQSMAHLNLFNNLILLAILLKDNQHILKHKFSQYLIHIC